VEGEAKPVDLPIIITTSPGDGMEREFMNSFSIVRKMSFLLYWREIK